MNTLRRSLLLAIILLFAMRAAGAATYSDTATTFNWVDASSHTKLGPATGGIYSPLYKFSNTGGCGTTQPNINDTLSDNIPIGFTFMYAGVNFTQVRVMSNGRLQFNNNTTCGNGSPVTQLPYPNAGLNYTMRIYGGDLDPSLASELGGGYTTSCTSRASCYVSYATTGSAPNRNFIVTWNNVPEWTNASSATGNYNVQVILHENGEFIYQYGANTPGPGNAAAQIGWQADSNDYDVAGVGYPAANSALKFYIARPVAEYRMEQSSWNGTAGEVLDTSGNAEHGTALVSGATTRPAEVAGGKVCRGAQIANNTTAALISAINTGIAVPTSVGGVGTITFWYNNASNTPNVTRVLFDAATVNNRRFYLSRSNTNALSFVVTDSGNTHRTVTTANNVLPTTGWSHIAVSWNFNNLAAANSDRLRIWVNGVLLQTTAFTTANTISAQINTLYIGDNRSSVSTVVRSAGNPGGSNATLDEFRIYNYEGGLALVQRDMNQAGACLDHYAITHSGTGLTCMPAAVTVTAHDSGHGLVTMPNNTTSVMLSTSTGQGDWTLISGYGALDNGTANDGIATYVFNGEYQAVFGLTHGTAGTVNINVTDGQTVESASEDPALTISDCVSNFNACHNYAGSNCSAASGKLYTRLGGASFATDLVALDAAGNVNTSFTGQAVVSLIARAATGTVDAQRCFTPDYTQVLDNAATNFTAGKLTVNASVADAHRDARIKVVCDAANCPPSGMTWCSTDNFAIRPQSFTVTANLGGPKLKAGLPFTLTADSGVTSGYNGTPVLDTANLRDHTNATVGSLTGSLAAATDGRNSIGTFFYHDVGTISLLADAVTDSGFTAVDQPNDCVSGSTSNSASGGKFGCNIGSASTSAFGRFYPDHFTYVATLTPACVAGGFTYMDQPALGINLTLEARSFATEIVTARYTSGYSTLGSFSITGDNAGAAVALARLTPALPAFTWTNGSYTLNANYAFGKNPAADGPYDSFALLANVNDPDGVAIVGGNSSNTTRVRYGKLRLQNSHGSELLSLPVVLQAQYWANGSWLTNTLDNCTTIPASGVRMDGYTKNLTACATILTPSGTWTLAGGALGGGARLSPPGSLHTGSVDLTVNTAAASGNTCLSATPSAATNANLPWFTTNSARATFGVYKGNNEFIYLRESY